MNRLVYTKTTALGCLIVSTDSFILLKTDDRIVSKNNKNIAIHDSYSETLNHSVMHQQCDQHLNFEFIV